jgi:FkbM family methyltransferase
MSHGNTSRQWLAVLAQQASLFDRMKGARRAEALLDAVFYELVRAVGVSGFIEVGAHDGQRSVRVKFENPATKVIALEANPNNHRRYSQLYNFPAVGVDYRLAAAAETNGIARFNVESDQGPRGAGDSSLLPRAKEFSGLGGVTTTVEVPSVALDSITQAMDSVALWVDVEGASGLVLKGATETLGKTAILKVEVEEASYWEAQWRAPQVVGYLIDYGLIPIARDLGPAPAQYNILFASERVRDTEFCSSTLTHFLRKSRDRDVADLLGYVRRHHLTQKALAPIRRLDPRQSV